MTATNGTSVHMSAFLLSCFTGIESWQHWISFPLAFLFLITILANTTLLITIWLAAKLHHPMFYYFCLLALVDLLLSFSITPKILSIVWFNEKKISSTACFTQVFAAFFCQGVEAGVTLLLAFDRYIAICIPLRYFSIITNKLSAQAVAITFVSNAMFMLPFPLLASNLHYCAGRSVANCFCEASAVTEIACEGNTVMYMYALAVLTTFMGILTLGLTFSYSMIIRSVLRLGSSESAVKTFRTCSSHLLMIGIVYCILITTSITSRIRKLTPRYAQIVLSMLRYLTLPTVNPLLYGIRTQDFHQAFRNLLKKVIHRSSHT